MSKAVFDTSRAAGVCRWPSKLSALMALLLACAASLAQAAPVSVMVMEVEPGFYSQAGEPSHAAREWVASRFFEKNSDSYDFLIVFPAFPTSFGDGHGHQVGGLNLRVRNKVKGIGMPEIPAPGSGSPVLFGSKQRLKSYIDVGTLRPEALSGTLSSALEIVAHEVAHQWSGRAGAQLGIIGQDGGHWSFFLNSSASVLYGSEWRDNKDGTFTAVASRRRYSPLDLYLMGFLAPQEVPPFQLLTPGPDAGFQSTDIPPPAGTTLPATASSFTLAHLTATLGPRIPSAEAAQRDFRAAFILLVPKGIAPTQEQLTHVEQVRAAWANQFFFLTRGRAFMQTERVDRAPAPVSTSPSVSAGLQYLLARQGTDGSWTDHPETSIRETEAAIAALAFFEGTQVDEALARAVVRLTGLTPVDSDGRARRLRALAVALQPDVAGFEALTKEADPLGLWQEGGRGHVAGYGTTVLDTALVGLALTEGREAPEAVLAGFESYLLQRQNLDGGWPALEHGPSRLETTARVLQFLARRPRTDAVVSAASLAFTYLAVNRGVDGLFIDELDLPGPTAEVVLALAAWGQLGSWDGDQFADTLLARQLPDGSWEGSVYQTAQALRALRLLLVPNLSVSGLTLSAVSVAEGEGASAQVLVRNTGLVASGEVSVQAFDFEGRPFGVPQRLAPLAPGAQQSVLLPLDTHGHGGSDKLFVVVDPEGTVDETREDDNRVAKDFLVEPAPAGAELFVSTGSVVASPDRVRHVPQPTTVTATVGNAGLTAASGVLVSLTLDGTVVQSTFVDLPARTTVPVSFPVNIQGGPYPVQLRVLVDPSNDVSEAREDNNTALLALPAEATVDLRMASIELLPTPVEQGQDVAVRFHVYNAGTTGATNAQVAVSVVGVDGTTLATLPPATLSIASGTAAQGQVSWRASHAGTHTVVVKASHPNEAGHGDEMGTTPLTVNPSSRPNLTLGADAISTSPAPPLVAKTATVLAKVRNEGAAVGPFSVGFYLGNPEAGGTLLGSVPVLGLASREVASVSFSFTPESSAKQSLVVRADAEAQVEEFDESDNTSLLVIEPLPIADLLLTDADILLDDFSPRAGDTVSVSVSVYNQGRQPSSATQVELYLGGPEPEGKKIGSAALGALEGLSRREVAIAWPITAGLSGPQRLVALVNASGASPEQRTDNNRGERQVLIQSGAVAITEPFFSPNNDGVKDSTRLLYQLPEPGPSVVHVTTLEGERLRTLEMTDADATFGSATWDGRDDTGKMVKDGQYRLTALAGTGSTQVQVGSVLAVVDTNRFPLEEVGDPALLRHVFPTAQLAAQQMQARQPMAMPDDSGIVYYAESNYDAQLKRPCGFYFQSLLGGEPQLLTPDTWTCQAAYQTPLLSAMAPDGSAIAYLTSLPSSNFTRARYGLRMYSLRTRQFTTLHEPDSSTIANLPIQFSADSRRVLFVTGSYNGTDDWITGREVKSADVGTGEVQYVHVVSFGIDGALQEFKLSPDESRIAYRLKHEFGSDCYYVGTIGDETFRGDWVLSCATGGVGDLDWAPDGMGMLIAQRESLPGVPSDSQWSRLLLTQGNPYWDGQTLMRAPPNHQGLKVAVSPHRDVAIHAFKSGNSPQFPERGIGLLRPIVGGQPQPFSRIPGVDVQGVASIDWSPLGTFIHGQLAITNDWRTREWALSSLANLPARIQASRPPGSSAISLRGIATDLNFDSYTIAVRPFGATTEPVIVARRQVPVIDGVLATWTPPGPGLFEVWLTVKDKAGNAIKRSTKVAWSNSAAIAELSIEPTFISPNNDLSQDEALVQYRATSPITTRFSVAHANGQVVRTFDRTHLEAEPSSFVWDGRDDAGNLVADGDYTIGAERVSSGVVVDSLKPAARLSLGALPKTPDELPPLFQFYRVIAHTETGGSVEIPSVRAWVNGASSDLHLSGWQLERVSGVDSTVLKRGSDSSKQYLGLPVEELRRGRLRLRAQDHAGNTELSPERGVPERLFLVGIGEASLLESGGTLRYGGRTLPRIDRLRPVENEARVDAQGEPIESSYKISPSRFVFTPQRYAFALANTVGEPIVSYAVAYPSPVTGAEVVDHDNVMMLAEDAILWDARLLPERAFNLKILATDAKGRVFKTEVPFDPRARVETCVGFEVTEEVISVRTRLARGTLGGEELAEGAVLEITPMGADESDPPEMTVSINVGTSSFDPTGITYSTYIKSGSLARCNYSINVRGQRKDGSEVKGGSILNICGLILSHGQEMDGPLIKENGWVTSFGVIETFRQPIRSMDVHLRKAGSESWSFAGTLPGFSGSTRVEVPPTYYGDCEGETQVRLVAHLEDGSVVDSLTQTEQRLFKSCIETPKPKCAATRISAVRQGNAPLCTAQEATYDVAISARTNVTGGWKALVASLSTPTGVSVSPLPLNITQTVNATVATATVETGTLPEGEYRIQVDATDATGTLFRTISQPGAAVFADRTPVQLAISDPAPGAHFCAQEQLQSDGTRGGRFNFRGFLADDWLESATLRIRRVGDIAFTDLEVVTPGLPRRVVMNGVLQSLDASKLPPGAYELAAHARDASGGSVCPVTRTFFVDDAISVEDLEVVPTVFAPHGGPGTVNATQVDYLLEGYGKVRLVAMDQGGTTWVLHEAAGQTSGSKSFPWYGNAASGPRLPDGAYRLRVEAIDSCSRTAVREAQVVLDTQAPVARIDAPASGTSVGALIQVKGEASDSNFKHYELLLGEGLAPVEFKSIASSGSPVKGLLGTVSTAGLEPGDYTIALVAEDEVGLRSETKVSVKVVSGDLVAGFDVAPHLISPNGDMKKDTAVATLVLHRPAEKVELRLVGADDAVVKTLLVQSPLGSGSAGLTLPPGTLENVPEGSYRVQLLATAGSITETAFAPLTLDLTPPSLQATSPANGGFLAGRGDVVGAITDPHLTAWRLTHTSPAGEVEIASGNTPETGTLAHLEELLEGTHRLVLNAEDGAGNTRTVAVEFISDTTPPRIAFLQPLANDFLNGSLGSVQVAASLEESHLSEVKLQLERDGAATRQLYSTTSVSGTTVSTPWSVASESDGAVRLVWTATDRAGNQASARIPVVVDTSAPVAKILAPRDSYLGSSGQFLGTASDANLESYTLEIASGPVGSASVFHVVATGTEPVQANVLTELPVLPSDGVYTARLTVRDVAGNTTEDLTAFIVDTQPPAAPVLTASVKLQRHIQLGWTASSDAGEVRYRLLRGSGTSGPLTLVGDVLLTTTSTEDILPADGTYRYVVIAVDVVGLESEPSNEASVEVDLSPPMASITQPSKDATVGGVVEVMGSAFAADDFKEYRLFFGEGAAPTAFTPVLTSPAAVSHGSLGLVDLSTKPQGSVQTIRLEAEDLDGNVATVLVTVKVDNAAPARPVLVSADPADPNKPHGPDRLVVWQDLSKTEADLAGYLLFRNGIPVNAPSGSSLEDLSHYLLPPASTSKLDQAVPDGVITYELQAMDLAGNLSERSSPIVLNLDRYAPAAKIVSPASLSRLSEPVMLMAEVPDLDVARVQFQVRAGSATDFQPLGPALERHPYTVAFDPAAYGPAAVEVRAVATDRAGNADASPVSSYFFRDAVPPAPEPTFTARAYKITLGWKEPNPAGSVAGHLVKRASSFVGGDSGPRPVGTASASSTGAGSAAGAYDNNASTSWVSAGPAPQRWELVLSTPRLVEQLSASYPFGQPSIQGARADLLVRVRGLWVVLARGVLLSDSVPVNPPLEVEAVAYAFTQTPGGKAGITEVNLRTPPLVPGPTLDDPLELSGSAVYTVSAVTPFGLSSSGGVSAVTYSPSLSALPSVVPTPSVLASGVNAPPGSTVEVLRGNEVVTQGPADAQGRFAVETPLLAGDNTLRARALYGNGSLSADTSTVVVRYQPPPQVDITLSLSGQSGADAAFAFTVSGDTSTVTGYRVRRAFGTDTPAVTQLSSSARSFSQTGLANGLYRYTVVAVNTQGFESAPSNEVALKVDVQPPEAPSGLVVTAPPTGSRLDLTWNAVPGASRYLIERALSASGPFVGIASGAPITAASHVDAGLQNGTTYYYRVLAVDAYGNRSMPSGIASGTPREDTIPEAPRLLNPTRPGAPLIVTTARTPVSGMAEPGAVVELFRNGQSVGTTVAGPNQLLFTALPLAHEEGKYGYSLSADGKCATYIFTHQPSGAPAIAVEAFETGEVQVLTHPDVLFYASIPVLSSDKSHVAAVAVRRDGGARLMLVGDAASGSWKQIHAASPSSVRAMAWSPDSARIAYVSKDSSGNPILAVGSVETGVEQIVGSSSEAYDFHTPTWVGPNQVLAIVEPSNGGDWWKVLEWTLEPSVSTRELFSAPALSSGSLVVSPSRTHLLVVASFGWSWDVYLIDRVGGEQRMLAGSVDEVSPAFSPDETRIAYHSLGALTILEPGSGELLSLGYAFPAPLLWTTDGLMIVPGQLYAPHRIDWGGPFVFNDVELGLGTNRFVAFATDGSGNRSPGSEPIEVVLDLAGLPDLTVSAVVQPAMPLAGHPANAIVTVKNAGGSAVSGVELAVSVLGNDGSTRAVRPMVLSGGLAPGDSSTVFVPLELSGLSGAQQLVVVADPRQVLQDSERGNNQAVVPFKVVTGTGPAVAVQVSPARLPANGNATVSVALANPGPARELAVEVVLRDASGARVMALGPDELFNPVGAGAQVTFTRTLASSGLLAGGYEVVVRAREGSTVVATAQAPVELLPEHDAALALSASRTRYGPGEPIELAARVTNRSSNALLEGARLVLEVKKGSTPVSTRVLELPLLTRGASVTQVVSLEPDLEPGTYQATAWLMLGGDFLARSEAAFVVEGRPFLRGDVVVLAGTGEPPAIPSGGNATVSLAVTNAGTAPAEAMVVRLRLIEPALQSVVGTWEFTAGTLAPGASWSTTHTLPTAGLGLRTYAVSLTAERTGAAEANLATARFRVADSTVPVIVSTNLSDSMFVRGAVSAELRVLDEHAGVTTVLASVDGMEPVSLALTEGSPLNGLWSARIPLGADGTHQLTFSAADQEGNDGRITPHPDNPITLTVVSDTVRPEISFSGVIDGRFYDQAVTPGVTVSDAWLAGVSLTLDGRPYVSGTPVEADGRHVLQVEAHDKAGNRSSAAVTFGVDRTAPVITVSGVSEGGFRAGPFTPVVEVRDANLLSRSILLDGQPFLSGAVVSAEGSHLLEVEARDEAGHVSRRSVSFTIDLTPPALRIDGVLDGEVSSRDVVPVITATDAHLLSFVATLDGKPYGSGEPVTGEGTHMLQATAVDRAGNSTTETVSFTIDRTPPAIVITGVTHGGTYEEPVTPVVTFTEAHPGTSSVTLDGLPFVPGTAVETDGVHLLVAEARDLAGNSTRVEVSFTLLRVKYEVTKWVPSGFARVLALVRGGGGCELPASEVARLSAYLEAEVKQTGGMLQVVSDEQAFQAALRTGLFNLFILVSNGPPAAGCDAGLAMGSAKDAAFREANIQAMTERLFSGSAGLLVIRPGTRDWPRFREALGVDTSGLAKQDSVTGWSGPFGTVDTLTVTDRNVQLKLYGAVPAARYGDPKSGEVAVATYVFGAGRSVTFGFDPSRALPPTGANTAFQSALAWVLPSSGEHAPLGVAAVELSVANLARPADTRVRELLAPALTPLFTDPAGTSDPLAHTLEWRLLLERGGRAHLRYLVRLPDTAGTYETRTEVATMLPTGPRVFGSYPLTLEVHQTGQALLAEARAVAAALPGRGPDGATRARIERALEQIHARPVFTAADAEANLADLFSAVDDARSLRTLSPDQMRSALDRLIRYWEAQWSAL